MITWALRAVACLALLAGLLGCSEDVASTEADLDRLVELASAQLSNGDFASATEVLLTAHDLDPDNVPVLYNLGLAAQGLQDENAGLDWYERALEVDPQHVPSLYNSAILLERIDLADAIAMYRQVVELDPGAANAHMRLGFALQHLGEDDEAAEFLEEGLRLDPSMRQVEAPSYE